jgi:predicted O-methyltransferase YrrM
MDECIELRRKDSVLFSGLQDFIKECCHKDIVMAEIGCWAGESTALFAAAVKTVYAIDAWDFEVCNEGVLSTKALFGLAEKTFDRRALEFPNIVKIKELSLIAATTFKRQSLDMVYIDANHDYESVLNDIKSWIPNVKYGGIVAGHDYTTSEPEYGVVQAVNEVFGKPDKVFADTSWMVIK